MILARSLFMLPLLLGVAGCSSAQQQAAVGPSVDLAVCVIGSVATDVAAGKSWDVCVEDAIHTCGADAGSVVKVWTAHEAAMIKQGLTPPAIKGRPQ